MIHKPAAYADKKKIRHILIYGLLSICNANFVGIYFQNVNKYIFSNTTDPQVEVNRHYYTQI